MSGSSMHGPVHGATHWQPTNAGSEELEALVAEIRARRPDFLLMADMRHDPIRWLQGRWTHHGHPYAVIGEDVHAKRLLEHVLRGIVAMDEAFEANRSKAV